MWPPSFIGINTAPLDLASFFNVSNEGVQMHGGVGVTDEYDIGLYMKRARVAEQTFGNTEYHRNRYAELTGY